jgi:hypothetical protein
MKSCPTCNRTYADDTLTFCLVDGSILSAPYDPQLVKTNSSLRRTESPPTEILPSVLKPTETIPSPSPTIPSHLPPAFIPEVKQSQQLRERINRRWLIVGIAVSFLAVVGLVLSISRSTWLSNRNSADKQPEININPSNVNSTPTINSNVTSQSSPSPVEQFDVVGTWLGTFGGRAATLIINNREGNTFNGTHIEKRYQIAFTGNIDPSTRSITIQETRAIKGDWVLGKYTGSISSDGRRMNGVSKDKQGRVESWSFSKK